MFKLERKYHKYKIEEELVLFGYPVKIQKKEIVVHNQDLIDQLIKGKLYPDFNKLVKKILIFIDEETDPDAAALLLEELAKLYNNYLNKYEKFLSKTEKERFMRDLRLLTNELKSTIHKKVKTSAIFHGRRR